MTTPYRTFWPEGVEHDPKYDVRVPPWRALEAQSIAVRQELIKLEALGQPVSAFRFRRDSSPQIQGDGDPTVYGPVPKRDGSPDVPPRDVAEVRTESVRLRRHDL
jgi:hypothetical protein